MFDFIRKLVAALRRELFDATINDELAACDLDLERCGL